MSSFLQLIHKTLWSHGLTSSHGNINTLYLPYHNDYSHQSQQGDYIKWGSSFHKVFLWAHGLARSHDKLNMLYLCYHKAIKLDMVVSCYKGLPCTKSHSPQNLWSHEVLWQIKYVICVLSQGLLLLNVARCWLTMRGFHPESYGTI